MPQSYSNIFQPNTGAPKTNPYGMFTAPNKAANPFSMSAALQSKAIGPTLKPALTSSPTVKPIQQASQNGPTQGQVLGNLQKSGYSTVSGNLSGTVSGGTPQPPVAGNTNPSPNVVGQTFPEPQKPTPTTGGVPNNTGLYGGLVGQGVQKLQEAGDVAKEGGLIRQAMQRQTRDVMGNPYYSGSVKIGQAANIAQQQGSQLEGLATQEKALTGQGQAYLQGAGAAAPVQVPYGTQYISPITGQSPIGQGGSSSQQNPQVQAQTYAQEVATGKRSYADAIAGMGLYGSVGKQFLDQAIRTANPNFNFAQAQSLGANQGAVGPAYNFAHQALANVESAVANLGSLQKTNLPLLNAGANLGSIYSGVGSEQTRAMIGAVQTLRNAYAALLASARGGTPTDYSAQAQVEIPDQPTPNDISAIKHNFETLGGARVGIYGNPGSGGTGAAGAQGGSIYNF